MLPLGRKGACLFAPRNAAPIAMRREDAREVPCTNCVRA